MSSTPTRSPEQRVAALRKANATRMHRASVKRAVAMRQLGVFDAIDDPGCGSLRVRELLGCVPGLGETKTRQVMRAADISDAKRCGGLTVGQRVRLARELGERAFSILLRS
jgi:guanylate kinase